MMFYVPWLELMIVVPFLGAYFVRGARDPDVARRTCLITCGVALLCALAAWTRLTVLDVVDAHDQWDIAALAGYEPLFVVDALSAPLLPLAALLNLLTVLATLRTKVRRLSFAALLVSEALLLATLSCKQPWVIIGLLAAGTIPPWLELRDHKRSTRIYSLHMFLFVALLVAGQALVTLGQDGGHLSIAAVGLLMAGVLVRSGVVPVHCWMTDLFEHASFATALLFVTPMVGAYAAMRLVLPIAPEWALHGIAMLSLTTALYAAGMALVQREARRFFCYVFLSHSSLVLVGLETATPLVLTGALCAWQAVALSMAGFGLTLRSVEARTGRLSLVKFHGLYEHIPGLAALFLVTGLASIGFPGTIGFIGAELILDGAVQVYPLVGIAIVMVTALNGLAVLHAYFRVFTGTRHFASIDLKLRMPERIAVLVLTSLIIGGGLYPQPGVTSRYAAATQLLDQRERRFGVVAGPSRTVESHGLPEQALAPHWH